ncbi:MgtC/SapB family protein [Amaricoccus macauensis]|uniref:MgtC/SapB family protein n=1 Tax=Amaricoccus macauensis TaxID=57001 RepID=UPI003C7C5A0A
MDTSEIIMQDAMQLPLEVVLVRLGAAILLGAAIGIEREARSRPAGLRTHILVCLAACLFTLIGTELFLRFEPQGNMDPTRIIEAVTSGVAFLAAGTIIRGEKGVRGLTTGAGMWMAGAVGVAAGSGLLILAALSTCAAVVVIALIRLVEP